MAGQTWPACRAMAWGMHGTCMREGAWHRVEEQASRPGALGLCWHGALGLCWPSALASAGLVRWVYVGLVRWLAGAGLGLCWCWPGLSGLKGKKKARWALGPNKIIKMKIQ